MPPHKSSIGNPPQDENRHIRSDQAKNHPIRRQIQVSPAYKQSKSKDFAKIIIEKQEKIETLVPGAESGAGEPAKIEQRPPPQRDLEQLNPALDQSGEIDGV